MKDSPLKIRLENNQEQIRNSLQEYIISKPQDTIFAQITKSPTEGQSWGSFYSSTIWKLEQNRDAKMNISWSEGTLADGSKTLIRDARNMKGSPPLNSSESYTEQMLNAARAAEKVLLLELARSADSPQIKAIAEDRVNTAIEQIRVEVKKALTDLETGQTINKKTTKAFNTDIVEIVKNAGVEKAGKKIGQTKDFMNFEDNHHHISTLTRVGQNIAVESDAMMLGLTPILRRQFEAIAMSEIGKDINLMIDGQKIDMSWYNKLPNIQKDLVHNYAATIASGNQVIPTQLRDVLLGLKNAHTKSTLTNENGGLEVVSTAPHAGTPTCHNNNISDKQKQLITNQNIEQLNAFMGGKTVINVLNSPINPTGIDRSIRDQVKNTIVKGVSKAVTPFNNLRKFSLNDNSGFKEIVDHVANNHCDNEIIKNYLLSGKGKGAALDQLEKLPVESKELLTNAFKAKENMNTSHLLFDSKNSNAELNSHMNSVISKMHDKGDKTYNIVTICASGKDRTGTSMFLTAVNAMCGKLGLTGKEAEDTMTAVCNSGHTQFLASNNAGSIGCHGVKKDTMSAFPKIFSVFTGLQQDTASMNKFKFDDLDAHSMFAKPFVKMAEALHIVDKPSKIEPLCKDSRIDPPPHPTIHASSDKSLFEVRERSNTLPEITKDHVKNHQQEAQKSRSHVI